MVIHKIIILCLVCHVLVTWGDFKNYDLVTCLPQHCDAIVTLGIVDISTWNCRYLVLKYYAVSFKKNTDQKRLHKRTNSHIIVSRYLALPLKPSVERAKHRILERVAWRMYSESKVW